MEQNQINPLELHKMFDELAQKNWASSRSLFSKDFCLQLAEECRNLYTQGHLKQASIGQGVQKTTDQTIRGDLTLWLDENSASSLQQKLWISLQSILKELNKNFFLGLQRFEAHYALYPPQTGYDKHVDNFRGANARKITFILYLNANWHKDHGGTLSIYDPEEERSRLVEIEPQLGTFVLFRSDLFPHQVEKSFQPRLSVTGWFRNDAL